MSFLKRLFGKKEKEIEQAPKQVPPPEQEPALPPVQPGDADHFEQEIRAAVPRYLSKPKAPADLEMRHKETKEVIPFAMEFPDQFETWKGVQSLADRRGIIYSILDGVLGPQLELWQVIERFNDDRQPEKALHMAKEQATEKDHEHPDFHAALARTNFILTNYADAGAHALKCLQLDENSIRGKRILADIYHCTQREKEAHDLYEQILKETVPNDRNSMSITELLGFDGDMVNSPIYAFAWLAADKNVNQETWDWASEEFYYSPHFRSQHAFHLLQRYLIWNGFVKLLVLSQEMPWFRDAVVNAYNLIELMKLSEKSPQEKLRLKQIMDKNNWTDNSGLHQFTV